MKKSGEQIKSAVTHVLFVLILLGSIYFIVETSPAITGHAVIEPEEAKSKLESALSSSALFSQVMQGSICIVINDPEQPISLQATKSSSAWTVSETTGYCSGFNFEDVIIQFSSYDAFLNIVDNPTPRAIANGAISRDFEILQSRYVELGGNVVCDATFKVKFCPALVTTASNEQLIDADLTCCIDKLTSEERDLLEQHLQEGNFKDEIGILEQPSGFAGLNISMNILMLGGAGAVVIMLIIATMLIKGKGKQQASAKTDAGPVHQPYMQQPVMQNTAIELPPAENPEIKELKNYVVSALSEGYSQDDIRAYLVGIGWDVKTADRVITEAQKGAQ